MIKKKNYIASNIPALESKERILLVLKTKMIHSKMNIIQILSMQCLYLASFCSASRIGSFHTLEAKDKDSNTDVKTNGCLFYFHFYCEFIELLEQFSHRQR